MVSGIAKEDTQGRAGSEFMGSSSGEVWVTLAAKNSKIFVSWRFSQESKVRHGEVESLGWQDVKERRRYGESLNLVSRRHEGLK